MVNSTATENITAINEARKLSDVRSNLSNNEKKVIRRKLYKKQAASHFFKERENDGTLTDRQRNILKNIARYSKNISLHLKNLSKHQNKSGKYGHDVGHLYSKKDNSNINTFQKARVLLNERRSNLLHKETNEIRKKLHKKEAVYNFLKDKEQNGSLTNEEKKVLKRINKYLKNFKNDLDKLQKYQYNITHGIDYLFNEEDDYYKPKEVKSSFHGIMNYMKVKEMKILNYQLINILT